MKFLIPADFSQGSTKASGLDIWSVPIEVNIKRADHGRFFRFQLSIAKYWQGIEYEEKSFYKEMR